MPDLTDILIVLIILAIFGVVAFVCTRREKAEAARREFEPKAAKIKVKLCKLLVVPCDDELDIAIANLIGDPDKNRHIIGLTASDILQNLKNTFRYADANQVWLANIMLDSAENELENLEIEFDCLWPRC